MISRADRRVGARAVLPGRSHGRATRSPARRRSRRSRRSARRASSRTPPRSARTSASACRAGRAPPVDRRGARARLLLGLELVKSRETREMLVPFNAGGEAAAPVARMAKARARARPLPDDALERRHGRPALTITREEADEGLAILDEALAIADEHYEADRGRPRPPRPSPRGRPRERCGRRGR